MSLFYCRMWLFFNFRYNGKHNETLSGLCNVKWNEAAMPSENIKHENLPPTKKLPQTSQTPVNQSIKNVGFNKHKPTLQGLEAYWQWVDDYQNRS